MRRGNRVWYVPGGGDYVSFAVVVRRRGDGVRVMAADDAGEMRPGLVHVSELHRSLGAALADARNRRLCIYAYEAGWDDAEDWAIPKTAADQVLSRWPDLVAVPVHVPHYCSGEA